MAPSEFHTMRFNTLAEWLTWQETLHPRGIDLGLERVARVGARLGVLEPHCAVVTVGGTNGKGSTVAMLESIYLAAGYRVGAYTSPHLLRYNERVRIGGVPVGDDLLCRAFDRVDSALGEDTLSYFEFGTLAALWVFRELAPDVMILEVGLGGRLDAVNAVDPDVAVVTSVGLDHQEWLGNDREQIGTEKAGIFRTGRPAVCGEQAPPASVRAVAERIGARWLCAGEHFGYSRGAAAWSWHGPDGHRRDDLPLPALAGGIQLDNAAAALAAVDQLMPRLPVSGEALDEGLRRVRLAGRFQLLRSNPDVILDVAHNPAGAEALAATLAEHPVAGRTLAVFAMMADKDMEGIVTALEPRVSRWFPCGLPDVPRACKVEVLCAHLRARCEAPVSCHATAAEAFAAACSEAGPGDRVLVFGSFYTVAAVMVAAG